ncbi:aldehyde dehydrogenase [haloarchaeon 3A1-DGR]|nr:aldehyde dehydrogenase [haloarchaeon 3A1-DGR]
MQFTDTLRENHAQAREEIADRHFGAVIDGETRSAASGETFEPVDPAVNEPITTVASCGEADVNAAVEAADGAATDWGDMDATDRGDLLREWVAAMRDHLDEFALLGALEVGKPLEFARADVENGLDFFEYYASVAVAETGEHVPTGDDSHAYVRHEPYGVTGQILPWNYPILLMGWKVGAALAAGNTAVVKPPSPAPLSVILAGQLAAETLPDGVVNVVPGSGSAVGDPLIDHRRVGKISFTGSVPVGQEIMRTAADTVTPVTLELGGKNPFIVFPDADVEEAAATVATGGMYNAGQSCDSATRILVHEDVEEEFREAYLDELDGWEPGDPLAEGTTMGPLAYAGHAESVDDYVDLGREEGATLLRGGPLEDGEYADGAYYRPTVFDDVDPQMRIAREEVFGPVQFLFTFSEYEEAIEIANDVDYGLTAGVATGNPSVAHRAAADVEAGSVWVNRYFGTVPGTPFGGFKQSGFGRECAQQAIEEHRRTKAVNMAVDDPPY